MTLKTSFAAIVLATLPAAGSAQDAAEMARKLQDPLANISAVMTDNDVLFKTGLGDEEETSYSFQIQPVHAFSFAHIIGRHWWDSQRLCRFCQWRVLQPEPEDQSSCKRSM